MPGQFSRANRPARPGAYFNFEATAPLSIPTATGSIVAIPGTHTWGPMDEVVELGSYSEFVAIYGDDDSILKRAVKQAFQGEGAAAGGRGGAGVVLAYRHGGSAAAKSSTTINNTAGTPAPALTLTARYEGARGNTLRVSSVNYAADSAKNQIVIYDDTVEVERYTYTDTDVNDVAAQINAESDWVTATALVTGTALQTDATSPAYALQTVATGGNSGDTLTGPDWDATLDALEVFRFGIFCPAELDGTANSSILAAIKTWSVDAVTGLNVKGKRFLTVVGGGTSESITTANTRSATLADPNFVNVGGFEVRDLELLDSNGDPYELNSAQFAPRIAGVLASRGEALSATFARFQNVELVRGADDASVLSAFDGGTLTLGRGTDPVAPVRIERAVTTFISEADSERPYQIYRNPKYVRTIHGIENEITEWLESDIIGQFTVNDSVRAGIRGEVLSRLQARVNAGVIQANPTVDIDQNPPPSDDDEFVALVYGIKFGRSLEQVFNTVRVG